MHREEGENLFPLCTMQATILGMRDKEDLLAYRKYMSSSMYRDKDRISNYTIQIFHRTVFAMIPSSPPETEATWVEAWRCPMAQY